MNYCIMINEKARERAKTDVKLLRQNQKISYKALGRKGHANQFLKRNRNIFGGDALLALHTQDF